MLLTFLSLLDEDRETTVISKVPANDSEQPLGGEESGAMADVTPWALLRVAARRVATSAKIEKYMLKQLL